MIFHVCDISGSSFLISRFLATKNALLENFQKVIIYVSWSFITASYVFVENLSDKILECAYLNTLMCQVTIFVQY